MCVHVCACTDPRGGGGTGGGRGSRAGQIKPRERRGGKTMISRNLRRKKSKGEHLKEGCWRQEGSLHRKPAHEPLRKP